jgi:hypothetical protein
MKPPRNHAAEAISPPSIDPATTVALLLREAELLLVQAEIATPKELFRDGEALRDLSPFGR